MGYWEEKAELLKSLFCNHCGEKIRNKSAKCKECEKINCNNCYSLCKKCRKSTCRDCLEEARVNPNYCTSCGDEICFLCDKKAIKTCKGCKKDLCKKHIKDSSYSGFFGVNFFGVNYYCKDC